MFLFETHFSLRSIIHVLLLLLVKPKLYSPRSKNRNKRTRNKRVCQAPLRIRCLVCSVFCCLLMLFVFFVLGCDVFPFLILQSIRRLKFWFNSFGRSFFMFFSWGAIVLTKDPECTRLVPQGEGEAGKGKPWFIMIHPHQYLCLCKKRVPSKQSAEGGPNGRRCLIDKYKQLA